jgi:hypothetical protein
VTDPDLHDPDLLEEIELLGELVIAASGNDGPLPVDRVDDILGVRQVDEPAEGGAAGPNLI